MQAPQKATGWIQRQIDAYARRLRPTRGELRRFPELKHFQAPNDAAATLIKLRFRCFAVPTAIVTIALTIAVMPLAKMALGWYLSQAAGAGPTPAAILNLRFGVPVLFLVVPLAGMWIGTLLGRMPARRWLRRRLRARGVVLCIPCGYDMTGTGAERCSECGTPLDV